VVGEFTTDMVQFVLRDRTSKCECRLVMMVLSIVSKNIGLASVDCHIDDYHRQFDHNHDGGQGTS